MLITSSKNREQASPAFIWAHPGGGIALSAASSNELMVRFAHQFRCIVFSVDYELAPDAKLNKAYRDFIYVFQHVHANHKHYDIDRTKIVIGGDEAGAYICLNAAHLMAAEKRKDRPKMMLLRSPMMATNLKDQKGVTASGELYDRRMKPRNFKRKLVTKSTTISLEIG